MLKLLKAFLWARFEPTREEKINAAEKLLDGTGFHVHANPVKVKSSPLFDVVKTNEGGKEI